MTRLIVGLTILLLIAGSVPVCAYSYGPESIRDLNAVKAEFGEKPVEKISQLLAEKDVPEEKWRHAVASLALTGVEGADYLLSQLTPRLNSRLYDWRTARLLESLGHVYDRRAVECAVRVLVNAPDEENRRTALTVLQAQAEETDFGSKPCIVVKPDGTVAKTRLVMLGLSFVMDRNTRSEGRREDWPDRDLFLGISRRLRVMALVYEKEKSPLAYFAREVVDTIDKKEAELQAALAKIEAGEK